MPDAFFYLNRNVNGCVGKQEVVTNIVFLKGFEEIHKIHTFAVFNEVTDFCFVKLTAVFDVSESRKKLFFRLCFDPTFCLFCALNQLLAVHELLKEI